MASVFKRKRKVKLAGGKTVVKQSQKYYTRLTDADGIKRTIPLFRDKIASEQQAAQLQKEIELARAGVVDRYKQHRKRPLLSHLQEFKESLIHKGTTEKQACLIHNRAEAVIDNCKFVYISDISGSRVQRYLAERRRNGLSIRSSNFYLGAIKQFLNWMVADSRAAKNLLVHLKGQNPKKDIRHDRRALTLEEISTLLTVTLTGQKHHNMTGRERYMLYILALTTGFRAKELASLTWRSLNLSESEPSITILVGYAKNDKEATLPLRSDVAEQFRQWSVGGGFSPSDRVFPKFNENKGADMLRQDLEVADIPYQDENKRFADFHALRHSFCTHVIKSGATVKEAQTLARHSTSALTLDVYSHIGLYDIRRAVERLPQINIDGKDANESQAATLKTGTDNKPVDAVQNGSEKLTPKWTPFLTPKAFSGCNRSATVGNEQNNSPRNNENDNCLKGRELGIKKDSLALPLGYAAELLIFAHFIRNWLFLQ
ncbi:MAG: tyrosine-type recombinase/integrase [Planctomycetota bacterium]|jgi:site-specific recombinase XerD